MAAGRKTKVQYKVVGNHAVGGVEPGGTVKIENDADADRLVAGGHVVPVEKTASTAAPEEKD